MLTLATIILGISLIIGLLRLVNAGCDADRVIAIDVLSFQLLGMSVLLAFHDGRPLALEFALGLSLLGFLSTLILSRLIRTT